MDINDLRTVTTVVSLLTFLGIVWWAYNRNNAKHFDEAANLPFAEHDENGGASKTPPSR